MKRGGVEFWSERAVGRVLAGFAVLVVLFWFFRAGVASGPPDDDALRDECDRRYALALTAQDTTAVDSSMVRPPFTDRPDVLCMVYRLETERDGRE